MTLYLRILALLWSAAISVGNSRSSSVMVASMMSWSPAPNPLLCWRKNKLQHGHRVAGILLQHNKSCYLKC